MAKMVTGAVALEFTPEWCLTNDGTGSLIGEVVEQITSRDNSLGNMCEALEEVGSEKLAEAFRNGKIPSELLEGATNVLVSDIIADTSKTTRQKVVFVVPVEVNVDYLEKCVSDIIASMQ